MALFHLGALFYHPPTDFLSFFSRIKQQYTRAITTNYNVHNYVQGQYPQSKVLFERVNEFSANSLHICASKGLQQFRTYNLGSTNVKAILSKSWFTTYEIYLETIFYPKSCLIILSNGMFSICKWRAENVEKTFLFLLYFRHRMLYSVQFTVPPLWQERKKYVQNTG